MAQRRLISLWFPNGLPNPCHAAAPPDLAALALWCQCFSPLTATVPPDGILIDITGCAHLFGGEAAMGEKIRARLPGARLGLAGTAAAAWGLARFAAPGAQTLSDLPLAALDLPERVITKLRRVGIRRIGELARLPRAELTAGYGPEPVLKLAQAFGTAPETSRFIAAPPEWREIRHFAEPIFGPAQLQAALASLATKLCRGLAAAERGATSLVASFYRVDSQRPEIALAFAAPCRDAPQIIKLLIEKLQTIDPGFGVDAMALTAIATETLAPAQICLQSPAPDYAKPLNTLLNRLGPQKLWRVQAEESHIPEFAVRRRPITLPPVPWQKPRHPRPLKLLRKPDAITAIAPVPDDPPVQFSWQGKIHRIRHATGPERIARDWWSHPHDNARPEAEHIRDYYVVEDAEGARFWLFRTGLADGQAPARWFLHGFFG